MLWDMVFGKRIIAAWYLTKGFFHVHKRKIVASLVFDKRIIVAWLLTFILNIEAAVNKIAANLYTSETRNLEKQLHFCCCSSIDFWLRFTRFFS